MFYVTHCGDGHFRCQIKEEDLVSFDGSPLPKLGSDNVAGMSGGPALLMGRLHYPVVGVITDGEDWDELHLLHIATLDNVDAKRFVDAGL
jgi:hypothetical protein